MESTVDTKFPAILEYLPYRKADGTSIRDEIRLKYLAGFGYVSVRIDIRGSGNSEGIFDDEYSYQERADCTEILEWIAEQTWSNGKIVMFGKSWGGFNGLQMAALQPKHLAGVISAYSTDDRYSDDIHYCGGCIPAGEACPPHPEYQGGIEAKSDLFAVWKDRLDNLVPLDTYWFKHQTREPILDSASPAKVSLCSPQQTGTASGNWLGWGFLKHPDHSLDQRIDDGRSLCFDSSPLLDDLELFGFPSVQLSLSSNQPNALLCVRLCAIETETCASILVARGILNLTHFNSHEHPEELEINKIYNIDVTLSGVCVRLSAGYRLRLAVSTAYWPFVWPSPQSATVTIHLNRSSPSVLILPRLAHKCSSKPDFDLPEIAPGLKVITIRDDSISSIRTFDEINEISTLKITKDNGCILYPDGHLFDETSDSVYEINEYGPQTARVQIQRNA
ncbi:unnamed protein product, partial [Rotaria sordida]